jgi:hypothetical protein
MDRISWLSFVYLLGVLLLVGPAALWWIRRGGTGLRDAAIWLAIITAVVALYVFAGAGGSR